MDVLSEGQQVRLNEKKVPTVLPIQSSSLDGSHSALLPPPLPLLLSPLLILHRCRQVELRVDNERYLRKHPELRQLFKHFMAQVLEEKPSNVQEFAARFFTQPDLRDQVM